MSRGPGKARETAVATMHERPLPPTLLVRIVPLESCFIKHFLERCLIFDFKYLGRNDWRRRMNKCIKVPLFSCILFRRIIISNIIVTKGHITHNTADAIMRPVTPDKHFMSKKYWLVSSESVKAAIHLTDRPSFEMSLLLMKIYSENRNSAFALIPDQ